MRLLPFLFLSLCAPAAMADDVALAAGAHGCKVYAAADEGKSALWTGPCKDGFADGEGTLQWTLKGKPDLSYKGAMKAGRYHGVGYSMAPDNTQYEGQFVNGVADGFGIWVNPLGDRYDGDWKRGHKEGQGKIVYVAGGTYEGGWRGGVYHGKGTITYPGGRRAEYDFADGRWADEIIVARDERPITMQRGVSAGLSKWNKVATGLTVPGQLTWAQLSDEQKKSVAGWYPLMHPADEPPYPVSGQRNVLEKLSKIEDETGRMLVLVNVGADGKPQQVTTVGALSKETVKYVHYIFNKERFKPGKCAGAACAMTFAYRFSFDRTE